MQNVQREIMRPSSINQQHGAKLCELDGERGLEGTHGGMTDAAEMRAFDRWDELRGPRAYVRGEWEREWTRIQLERK